MTLLDKLERKYRRFAVPNLTVKLVIAQVVMYVVRESAQGAQFADRLELIPSLVLKGEVWRLFTFVVQAPDVRFIWAFFYFYLFYIMGTALEQTWGAFRYNMFLLIGCVATICAAMGAALFIELNMPDAFFLELNRPAYNAFLQGTVFLAFAYLYPDFTLMLFFIVPIKIKWLALLQWFFYVYWFIQGLVEGNIVFSLTIAAAVANFLLFFGKDILLKIKAWKRRTADTARQTKLRTQPRHCCTVCGVTDKTDPSMGFRYCSKCEGSPCYCEAHLGNHQHVDQNGQPMPVSKE